MMDYPNGGFCFVDLSGYTMTEIDDGGVTVPGLYAILKNAIECGKAVFVNVPQGLGSEESITAMAPGFATVMTYEGTTEIGFDVAYGNTSMIFVVSTADLVTIGG